MQNNIIKKIHLLLILILINAQSIIPQRIIFADEVKFGDKSSEIKILQQVRAMQFSDLVPDDIEVDQFGNIFIVDKQHDRILQFSSNLEEKHSIDIKIPLLKKLNTSDEVRYLIEHHLYKTELEFDSKNNLYVLISLNEFYLDIFKFDETGQLINEFIINGNGPQHYLRDFFISRQDKIYINTFPINILDIEYLNTGQVFVYDLEGDFIGRTDYFIEDNNSIAIKRNLLNRSDFQLDFFPILENEVKTTDKLILKNSFSIPYNKNKSWSFLGIDINNQLYFIQGRKPLIVRRINSDRTTYDDFIIDENLFKSKNILFKSEIKNVELTKSGEIILFGLKFIKSDYSCDDYFDSSEVNGSIIKLEF
jgi:hypothetical protein